MGLDVHGIINYFCAGGPYYCPMGDELAALVDELWREFDVSGYASPGELRYAVVRLLYMLLQLPYADQMAWYPRAQVDLVRDAETLMLADLSVRHTARELAVQFGVSESSFKACVPFGAISASKPTAATCWATATCPTSAASGWKRLQTCWPTRT